MLTKQLLLKVHTILMQISLVFVLFLKLLKKNVIWNTIGVTLNSFNSLFFLIIINRINGIDDGGIFSFAFSLACLLFVIGIYAGRTYQVSDIRDELNDSEYLAIAIECTYHTNANFIGIRPFFKIIVTITIRNIPTISNPFTKLSDS